MAVSMLSPTTTRIATLALRVLTAILLFASLIILLTNTQQFQGPTLHFYDRVGYSYAAVGIFLGVAYSIYQTVCAVIRIKKGSEGNVVFDFYAEKGFFMINLLINFNSWRKLYVYEIKLACDM
ncbi:PREDICTED: CASP [Prunus dulcis]|uniref:CASP-like protein n=1 Tax=Prunus dulcis TaxID=3755 RepID=A0A5E4E9S1_PRUDU|nr:PREDICTED: CASP [Prunus dulcis]